jgi:hypothetical protein
MTAGQRLPGHGFGRKDADNGLLPLELCRVKRSRFSFQSREQNLAGNRPPSPTRVNFRLSTENRQIERQGRRKWRRIGVRNEDRWNTDRAGGRREADLFGVGVARHDDRLRALGVQDGLASRIPRDRAGSAAGDEEAVRLVDPAQHAQCPAPRTRATSSIRSMTRPPGAGVRQASCPAVRTHPARASRPSAQSAAWHSRVWPPTGVMRVDGVGR